MPTFGPLLRRTREQRGVSLDAIAQETRLSKRYLTALEEETIDKLPGGTYNRAYLRTYARFLGLEPEGMLREYAEVEARLAQTEADELAAMNRALERRGELIADPSAGRVSWSGAIASPLAVAFVVLGGVTAAGGAVWVAVSEPERTSAVVVHTEPTVSPTAAAAPAPTAATASTNKGGATSMHVASRSAAAPAASSPEPAAPPSEGTGVLSGAPAPIDPSNASAVREHPADDTSETPARLTVAESGVGTAIVDRKLVGEADQFSPGSPVVFWTHVRGGRSGDTIDHVWFRDGALIGAASLSVGSPDWRTQSRRVLEPGGVWTVEARDPEGHVLARHEIRTSDE